MSGIVFAGVNLDDVGEANDVDDLDEVGDVVDTIFFSGRLGTVVVLVVAVAVAIAVAAVRVVAVAEVVAVTTEVVDLGIAVEVVVVVVEGAAPARLHSPTPVSTRSKAPNNHTQGTRRTPRRYNVGHRAGHHQHSPALNKRSPWETGPSGAKIKPCRIPYQTQHRTPYQAPHRILYPCLAKSFVNLKNEFSPSH
jgi:hypothetical protein